MLPLEDRRRMLEPVMAAAARGCADVAEAVAAARRAGDGDPDTWVYEWSALAGGVWVDGLAAAAAGRTADARRLLLHAATYYAAALAGIACGSEPERGPALWRRQRDCFDTAAALLPVPPETIRIPYEGTSLTAVLFRSADAAPGEARPLVVVDRGEATASDAYVLAGAPAADRGYHWLTFDGPGQGAARYAQGLRGRPDWEAVLTPVVDAVLDLPGIDGTRLALVGLGSGGYHVLRALAFEHRLAAATADPAVSDVAGPWLEALPPDLRGLLDQGEAEQFDRELRLLMLFDPPNAPPWRAGTAVDAPVEGSAFRHLRRLAGYRIGDEAAAIATPVLLTERPGDPRWAGQATDLAARLLAPHRVVRLPEVRSAADAAERERLVFQWLDEHLAP